MDPVSLIVGALIVGATRSIEEATQDSLKLAYAELKNRLKSFFVDRPAAQDVLEEIESSPEAFEPLLRRYVEESKAIEDAKTIQIAQEILRTADDRSVSGEQNFVTGNITANHAGAAAVRMNNVNTGGYHGAPEAGPNPS